MNISPDLLKVTNLSKSYLQNNKKVGVLDNITLNLKHKNSLAIVGPSGCGKTTLLLILAGLLKPDSGKIFLNGKVHQETTNNIALVLQTYGLLPWKTVSDNIILGIQLQGFDIDTAAVATIKRTLGIEHLDKLYPEQLSGGQKQRVALARVFLLQPKLLLMDEPFSALDAITRERLQHYLMDEYRKRKFGFIVVTHSIEEAVALGQQIMILNPDAKNVDQIIENQEVFNPGFRSSKSFFDKCYKVHKALLN